MWFHLCYLCSCSSSISTSAGEIFLLQKSELTCGEIFNGEFYHQGSFFAETHQSSSAICSALPVVFTVNICCQRPRREAHDAKRRASPATAGRMAYCLFLERRSNTRNTRIEANGAIHQIANVMIGLSQANGTDTTKINGTTKATRFRTRINSPSKSSSTKRW